MRYDVFLGSDLNLNLKKLAFNKIYTKHKNLKIHRPNPYSYKRSVL